MADHTLPDHALPDHGLPATAPAETTRAETTTAPAVATALGVRDRLLLAFAELGMYGITTQEGVAATPARARAEIAARLRVRAPHGLGSYAFWIRAEEDRLDAGLPLYTSGPEVDRAVVAACAGHGLTARPGPRRGVLLVS